MSAEQLIDQRYVTNGRKFERFDSVGGHGGPYHTLFSAVRDAMRLLKGRSRSGMIGVSYIRDRRSDKLVVTVEYKPIASEFIITPAGDDFRRVKDQVREPLRRSWRMHHGEAVLQLPRPVCGTVEVCRDTSTVPPLVFHVSDGRMIVSRPGNQSFEQAGSYGQFCDDVRCGLYPSVRMSPRFSHLEQPE